MRTIDLVKRLRAVEEMEGRRYTVSHLKHLFDSLAALMRTELLEGGEVFLPGTGKLVVVQKPACTKNNPRTGGTLHIPPRLKTVFRASKDFTKLLN